MSVAYDSVEQAANGSGSWTHTTSASALSNALLVVFAGTTNNANAPTTITCAGTAMTAIPNAASVLTTGDKMGVWAYYIALGGIAASQNYALTVSGGAGNWQCASVVLSGVSQSPTFTTDGKTNDSSGVSAHTSVGCPTGGLILSAFEGWDNGSVRTITGSGTVVVSDASSYNEGEFGVQYTTSGTQTWTFSGGMRTFCLGGLGIPAALGSAVVGSGVVAATGSATGSARVSHSRSATVSASAGITGASSVFHRRMAALSATGSLAASRAIAHARSGTISARGEVSATGSTRRWSSATVSALGTITATGRVAHNRAGSAAAVGVAVGSGHVDHSAVAPEPILPTIVVLDTHKSGLLLDAQSVGVALDEHTAGVRLDALTTLVNLVGHARSIEIDEHTSAVMLDEHATGVALND